MANEYNYFTQNIQRMGEEFLAFKNSKDFKRDAPNIFRQLARRQIDLEKYGHFFLEKQFLESCIDMSQEQILISRASATALYFYIEMSNNAGYNVDPYYHTVYKIHNEKANAYDTVHNYLVLLRDTQQLSHLYTLASVLSTNTVLGKAL